MKDLSPADSRKRQIVYEKTDFSLKKSGMLKVAYKTRRTEPTGVVAPSADGFSPEGLSHDMVVKNSNADKTILFADDDGQVQKFVATLLYKNGYNVIAANDGASALQKAREFKGVIHLLLADIEMPGMTGIELAIQISSDRPETKILLISGLDSGMLVLNNGWQFLPKPFMADMLRDRVRDFLSEQQSLKEHLASVQDLKAQVPSKEGLRLAEALPAVPTNGAPSPK